MTALQIQQLRRELGCSVGELAAAVGVETRVVLAWESGDEFPTKKHADRLEKLLAAGPEAFPRKTRGAKSADPLTLLGEPRVWKIVRKLLAHPAFLRDVEKLSEGYEDPPT